MSTPTTISDLFREFCSDTLNADDRLNLERLLQFSLGIRNLRNVQLWTRRGAQQRNFINSRLGEFELDLRTWIAEKLLVQIEPTFPTKRRRLPPPLNDFSAQIFMKYATDNWIREYTTRLFFDNGVFIIEYSADSSNNPDEIDFDSDEFSDVIE